MRSLAVWSGVAAVFAQGLVAQDPPAQDKIDFTRQIAPIFLQRCVECHGHKEQKGDLRLDAKAHLFHDTKDAWTVTPGKPDESVLVERIELPIGDEDIMPNKGEALRKDQIALIRKWIEQGADWPAGGDEYFVKAHAAIAPPVLNVPKLSDEARAATEQVIAGVKAKGASAGFVAQGSEAVDVNLSLLRGKCGDADVAALAPAAPAVVWLNLAGSAVTDAGLAPLRGMLQLRRLNLANTKVTDGALAHLAALPELEYLNLYGTQVGDDGLAQLAGLGKLRRLYLWNSKVTEAGAKALAGKLPELQIDRGEYVEPRLAAAQQEIAERDARKPVNDKCPLTDKPVDLQKWLDHDGLRIAFCCQDCLAAFQKDPAKHADKIAAIRSAVEKAAAEKAATEKAGKESKGDKSGDGDAKKQDAKKPADKK